MHDLCRELPSRGWQVELALASGDHFNLYERFVAQYPDVTAHCLMPRAFTRSARVSAVMDLVRKLKPDIVVATRIADTYEAVARLKLEGLPVRLGAAVRGFEAGYVQDLLTYSAFIDACFADGRLLSASCISIAGVEESRVANLPGGIRLPSAPRRDSPKPGTIRLGYVGRLAQSDKRVLDLVPLLDRLDRLGVCYSLDVVGAGPDGETLKERLLSDGRQGQVRLQGWKQNDELYAEVYPHLDVLLNFSPTEGVTISPREAMTHGVVPVLSRFPGLIAEGLFRHGENALTFPVGDMDEAAGAIARLWREPGLLRRLSAAATATQSGAYLFANSMAAWAEALDVCLAAPIRCKPPLPAHADFPRLERMGVPPAWADRLRVFLGRTPAPAGPGDEWPHILQAARASLERDLTDLVARLDGSETSRSS